MKTKNITMKITINETTAAVFSREFKKTKSNNDDKHDHGQEKKRHSTCVEGKPFEIN